MAHVAAASAGFNRGAPPQSEFNFPWGPVLGIGVLAAGGILIWKFIIPSPEEIADGAVALAEGAGDVAEVAIDTADKAVDKAVENAGDVVDLVGGKVVAPVTKTVGKTVEKVWDKTLGKWLGEGGDLDKMVNWPWEE